MGGSQSSEKANASGGVSPVYNSRSGIQPEPGIRFTEDFLRSNRGKGNEVIRLKCGATT